VGPRSGLVKGAAHVLLTTGDGRESARIYTV